MRRIRKRPFTICGVLFSYLLSAEMEIYHRIYHLPLLTLKYIAACGSSHEVLVHLCKLKFFQTCDLLNQLITRLQSLLVAKRYMTVSTHFAC